MSLILAGLGLWWWPARRFHRPRCPDSDGLDPARTRRVRPSWTLPAPILLAAPVGAVVTASTALPIGLAAALLTLTVLTLVRSALRERSELRDLTQMLAATRTLAREVRSGAAPTAAVLAGATAYTGRSGQVLQRLSVVIAAGGSVLDAAPPGSGRPDLVQEMVARLATGWSMSQRLGVPWAALIEALTLDLQDRVQARSERAAQVSGPKVSGYVLAMMPALGVLLGMGMGADPVHVLFGTGAGHLMLLVGTTLTCAGLAWTARIVRG